jgi:hypothetical protein
VSTPDTLRRSSIFTPVYIDKSNEANAYFHSLGAEDRTHILKKIYSDPQELAQQDKKITHIITRWNNVNGEVWATTDKNPLKPSAIYTRIK